MPPRSSFAAHPAAAPVVRAAARAAAEPLEGRSYFAGVGQGLVAEYFADPGFQSLAMARTDATVNFAWPGSPAAGVPANKFSVRWTGQVLAPMTQAFTLYAASAGGVRVRLNGQTIIDNWANHRSIENRATVPLTAGQYYPLEVEYREDGVGQAKLSWSSPSTPKQVVPKSQLYRFGTAPMAGGWMQGNAGPTYGSVLGLGGSGTYTLRSGVAGGLGGLADKVHMLYRPLRGDGVIVARVNPVTAAGTEAGVVVRQTLDAGSAFVGLTLSPAGVSFESRQAAGWTVKGTPRQPVAGPVFLKVVKDGNAYAGYRSDTGADGSWQLVGTAGMDMGTFQRFGLAVGGANAAAAFTRVDVRPVANVGGNLNMQSDRVQDLPFVDLVKTTRGFYNTAGRLHANGLTDFATTDADGWPTEDFSFTAVDNTEWNVPVDGGTYKLSFRGPAGVVVTGGEGVTPTLIAYDPVAGTYAYDVTVGPGALRLTLALAGTLGQVRDVRLLQPGYDPAAAPTFTDRYLALLRRTGPNTIRFMDWTSTNGDPEAEWADRAKPTDATQAKVALPGDFVAHKGIAWEYCVELANTLGRNVWVNVPARATDAYVRELAALLRDTLRPDLNVYVEHSNEVWNTAFEQANYNKLAAVEEVFANAASDLNYDRRPVDRTRPGLANPQAEVWGERRHARRTRQIAELFRQTFVAGGHADPINRRVRVVLGGQASNLARFDRYLSYLSAKQGAPRTYLYGLGVAPYFGLNKYADAPGLTPAQVLEGMNLSVNSYATGTFLPSAFAKANAHGLRLIAYEGGPDTWSPTNIEAKRAASLDPAMEGIIARYLTTWYQRGGDLFNYYTLGGRSYSSPNGTWSVTEDLDDLGSPKLRGFLQVREGVPASTAARGVYA